MARPYSPDLRERVVAAAESGLSCREVAERFVIAPSTVVRWTQLKRAHGSPAARPIGRRRPFVLAGELTWLLARLAETPDITLRALLAELRERGIEVSYYALWHILARAGISFKKKPARQRAGPSRRRPQTGTLAAASGSGRPAAAGLHR
jgi:transposase